MRDVSIPEGNTVRLKYSPSLWSGLIFSEGGVCLMTPTLAISTPGHVHPEGSIGTSLLWTPPWPDELVKGLICCCWSPRPVPIGDISGHAAYEDGRTPHYPPHLPAYGSWWFTHCLVSNRTFQFVQARQLLMDSCRLSRMYSSKWEQYGLWIKCSSAENSFEIFLSAA